MHSITTFVDKDCINSVHELCKNSKEFYAHESVNDAALLNLYLVTRIESKFLPFLRTGSRGILTSKNYQIFKSTSKF